MSRREPPNKIITNEDMVSIIKSYHEGLSPEQIRINILNSKVKTNKSIVDALKRAGEYTHRDKNFYSKTKNHNYFDVIDTEYKAYLLGLLQSDGWIARKGDNSYVIGLSLQEDYIIEKFKEELCTENKIVVVKKRDEKHKTLYQLQVSSYPLYKTLEQYEISNKNTAQFFPANIPENLKHHYIRGLFDGDGLVHVAEKTKNIHIGFLGGIESMSQIAFYLSCNIDVYQKHPISTETEGLYTLIYSEKEDVDKLYKFLYNNATIYIKRKKDIMDEWFKNSK